MLLVSIEVLLIEPSKQAAVVLNCLLGLWEASKPCEKLSPALLIVRDSVVTASCNNLSVEVVQVDVLASDGGIASDWSRNGVQERS